MKILIILTSFIILVCSNMSIANSINSEKTEPAHPLTDGLHVDVYHFISNYLEVENEKKEIPNGYNILSCDGEKAALAEDPHSKPHSAVMHEGEIAGLLRVLLSKNNDYESITIYGDDGVGLATSGMRHETNDPDFGGKRPECLNLGFLTHDILNVYSSYIYHVNGVRYKEIILSIVKKDDYYETSDKIKRTDSVGYLSYIIRL